MFDYMAMLNRHAFNQLVHPVEVPDNRLMIASAETLAPQSVLISQATIPKDVAENLRHLEGLTDEEVHDAIDNGILEVNDFNGNTAIVEEMLGVYK